eukprot:CAMPEP_0181358498 /NCGR_PEP_ID=MMETSP1106-20121128/5548_1 /TAXON_ID=81844 /ORGANISM="Mantoniella antarctica, Strain SL-175" /LENGTH=678 /DNA_ID=CAMNT_0023471475 /DNA_START=382 /DNA_END=2418 /DNA_ORIENTATION=+
MTMACTNILVSPGASEDGSTLLAYNADSGALYGSLGHYPAATHLPNATRDVWDWDDSVFLGTIPEAAQTLNVIGNANEAGVVIGETTFGGLPSLDSRGSGGVMDYGSLIWIALQRARTCRAAIHVIDRLVQRHGYASDGESFSCVDGKEAWLMELIGKGAHEKGAVWVASKVPDGAILAHANQARTTTFVRDDPDTVMFSPDVVSFARKIGRYPAAAPDAAFDFSAAYDPVTFSGARHGEARVWDIYRHVAGPEAMDKYIDYARGFNLTNRMPLFVYPVVADAAAPAAAASATVAAAAAATTVAVTAAAAPATATDASVAASAGGGNVAASAGGGKKLSVEDVMRIMRTRFEGTWFDTRGVSRADVGAGSGHSAYRWRPLIWHASTGSADSATSGEFVNERTVATQQTAWNFVAASRPWLPGPIAAVQWWAPDDSATSLRVPIYGGATKVPYHFADATGQVPAAAVKPGEAPTADALTPSMDSAFWIWNLVSNLAYGDRADVVSKALEAKLLPMQERLMAAAAAEDAAVAALAMTDGASSPAVVARATAFCELTADGAFHAWQTVFLELFALTRDGFTITRGTHKPQCAGAQKDGCTARNIPDVMEQGYEQSWYDRVATDGDNAQRYGAPPTADDNGGRGYEMHKRLRMNKKRRGPPPRGPPLGTGATSTASISASTQ